MNKTIKLTPAQLLIFVFIFFIFLGTILLLLPFSTNKPITFIDALFTTVSAMTVTGLGVVDTGTHFTYVGQFIIALLIQLGGLGIMTFSVFIFIVLGKKIGFKHRLIMQHALNQVNIGGVIKLVKNLFFFSITIEFIAMIILALRLVPEFGWKKGLFSSFFHSISAFNNAGFALWPDNLIQFVGDPIINIIISALFIIGGIGFTVLVDLKEKNSFSKLSLHSKMMIVGTLVINIVSILLIFALEYRNPHTLGSLTTVEKLWASYFQAVSPRTAGFNTIDIGSMNDPTIFFITILMFIGAGSASTGGGIKLTTFMVILFSTFFYLRGRDDIQIYRRNIPSGYIARVTAIAMTSILVVVLAVLLINIIEPIPFLPLLFEVVSAFGTVGLSMGITASLTVLGKLIIIIVMFIGKIGPLTLMFMLARPQKSNYKYPDEEILTG